MGGLCVCVCVFCVLLAILHSYTLSPLLLLSGTGGNGGMHAITKAETEITGMQVLTYNENATYLQLTAPI